MAVLRRCQEARIHLVADEVALVVVVGFPVCALELLDGETLGPVGPMISPAVRVFDLGHLDLGGLPDEVAQLLEVAAAGAAVHGLIAAVHVCCDGREPDLLFEGLVQLRAAIAQLLRGALCHDVAPCDVGTVARTSSKEHHRMFRYRRKGEGP